MSLSSSIADINLLRQIAERSLSAFFIYNLQTHQFDYLNSSFEEIWEREEQEVNDNIPALISDVFPEDLPLLEKCFHNLLKSALRQTLEFRISLESGRAKWISLTAYAILQEEQRHFLAGFAEDITHVKENEIVANKFATHKDAILEMLSHDLGGPLGMAMQLVAKVEQEGQEHGIKAIEEKASIIHKTLEQSILLIHDYLEQEYLTSVQTALKKQRVEIIEQLEVMIDGFRRMDQDGHKHYLLESSNPKVLVEVDQVKFQQVFSNLVSNANKFTHKGGHITVRVQEQEQSVLISVSDDGIGIPASMQEVIFDRFTKARRPGLRGEVTVGLGLSIVKRLVEMHQGKIWVESEENKGTTFFVEIPEKA